MTKITLSFDNYPIKGKLYSGTAEIAVAERVLVRHPRTEAILLPLQRPIKWEVVGVRLKAFRKPAYDRDDLDRYIQGRYWPCVAPLFYARLFEEEGLARFAAAYRKMAEIGHQRIGETHG